MSDTILSCDWGTTNVRLRRVEVETGRIGEQVASDEGVRSTHAAWRASELDRTEFYLRALGGLVDRVGRRSTDRAIILSGMVSSSLGMLELPYAEVPFRLDGADLICRALHVDATGMPVLLVSGLRTDDDVMRGEETELVGLHRALGAVAARSTFILPGTHSKHVDVEGDVVTGFRTFMTGELFDLLSGSSILAASVERGDFDRDAFDRGVRAAADRPLLNALFTVRTNALFGRLRPSTNYWYLSGLLIGSELAGAVRGSGRTFVLGGTSKTAPVYRAALETLGASGRTVFVPAEQADRAAADGHLVAYERFLA